MKTRNLLPNQYFLKASILLVLSFVFIGLGSFAWAQGETSNPVSDSSVCSVYISGIGCSNCAVTDPALFINGTAANPNLVVIEYEIYLSKIFNRKVSDRYFKKYLGQASGGVPFLVLDKSQVFIGKFNVLKGVEVAASLISNDCPLPDGDRVPFERLDLTSLPGKFNIWTKNRVLISGNDGNKEVLKKLILEPDISLALSGIDYEVVDPKPVLISKDQFKFEYAVKIGNWRLQWNGAPLEAKAVGGRTHITLAIMLMLLILLGGSFSLLRIQKTGKGRQIRFDWKARKRDLLVMGAAIVLLGTFFVLAKDINPMSLEQAGYTMPLPLFTFIIGFLDGINPCNMFVLTAMLALLVATTASRLRLFVVSFVFVVVVFLFYFLFMAAWLNVFQYVTFVKPLRIVIALLALIAGVINCKELIFFQKGISLTIPQKQKGPLFKRMERLKEIIKNGSFPLLITSSIALAVLSSLVEIPCTAGFPLIYTSILSGRGLESTWKYYAYLTYYNVLYVLPLLMISSTFIFTFRARQITQRQAEIIKYVGGVIMILLGLLLLSNPALLGIHVNS